VKNKILKTKSGLFLICCVILILCLWQCGRDQVVDQRYTQPPPSSQNTPSSSANNSLLRLLPPLYLFRIPLPINMEYQAAYLYLHSLASDPTNPKDEVRTLKEQASIINTIFKNTRVDLAKIKQGVSSGTIQPETTAEGSTTLTTTFDPISQLQSKLTIIDGLGGALSWTLERKKRSSENFTIIFTGNLTSTTSTTNTITGSFTFLTQHENASYKLPLPITYLFEISEVFSDSLAKVPSPVPSQPEESENQPQLLPSIWYYLKQPNDDFFNLTNSLQNTETEDTHIVLSATIGGKLYKETISKSNTTYTATNVTWILNRNITLNTGSLLFDTTTLKMVNSNKRIAAGNYKSYRFSWDADGSGKAERFTLNTTSIGTNDTGGTSVCWNQDLKYTNCESSTVDNNNSNN